MQRRIITALVVFALYFASAAAAIYWTREAGSIAAVWLSNALVAGLVLRRGRDQLLTAMIGTFPASVLVNLLFGFPVVAAIGFSFAHIIEIGIIVGILGAEKGQRKPVGSITEFVRFLLIAAVVAPAAASVVAALAANAALDMSFGAVVVRWYLSSAFGALLLLTPFVLSVHDTRLRLVGVARTDWTVGIAMMAGLCVAALFLPTAYQTILSLGYLVWIGYRWGPFGASIAGLIIAVPRLVGHYAGLSWYIADALPFDEQALAVQGGMAGSIAASIATVLALRERDETRQDLNIARQQLREMENLTSGTTFQLDVRSGRAHALTYGASARNFATTLGLASMPASLPELLSHLEPGDRESVGGVIAGAVRDVTICSARFHWPLRAGTRWIRLVALPKTTHDGATVFDGVLLDVTDKVENEEARKAQIAQTALATARSSFLAAASHDLRQPLHALGLYLHTLERRLHEPQDLDIVRSMKTAAGAMSEMFTALLDLAKIESGTLCPNKTTVSVDALLREVLSEVLVSRGARQDRLRVVRTSAYVETDPILLKMILRNLVTNALKYAPKGRVLVGVRRAKDSVRILVVDRGPGIDPKEAAHIFDDFYRGNAGRAASMQGIGLGLAIARRTSELLDAKLGFSTVPGRGTSFEVAVPGAVGASPSRATTTQAAAGPARAAGQRILIVEDEPAVAAGLKSLLAEAGFSPLVVTSARDAFAVIREGIDGAVIDYQLAGEVNGLDLAAYIRTSSPAQIPILLVSGLTDADAVRRFNQAGLRWLAKPVAGDRLIAALFDALDARAARRASQP